MYYTAVTWLAVGLTCLMAGCTAIPESSLVSPTNQPEQPFVIVTKSNEPGTSVESIVAQTLNVTKNSVVVKHVANMEWADSCLGLPKMGEVCAQVIVPGFKTTVQTPNGMYQVNSDREKRHFRLISASETLE